MKRVFKFALRVLIRHRLVLAATCILVAGSLARPVAAQYDAPSGGLGGSRYDALNVELGGSITHDSNLFRVPELLGDTPSEIITTAYARLRIDKPYAQQRFVLDATATAYRYDKFSYLNFDGLDYQAAWYWHLTPRLSGTLSADRTQTPTQFQDTRGLQSNVIINENNAINMDGRLFGGWHVLLGASQSYRTSEQSTLERQPDYRQSSGEAGARYLFRSGSEIAAVRRRIEGHQYGQLLVNFDSNYREDDSELRAIWNLSPKSILTGHLTYLDRRYDQAPQRDFSTIAGQLLYTWLPTAKLSLRLSATRNIVPWQSLFSNYSVSNTLSVTPTWKVTARTNVNMSLQRTYDDYPSSSSSTGVPERKATTSEAVLGLDWFPTRNVSLSASQHRQQRSSNDPLLDYHTTISRIRASLLF